MSIVRNSIILTAHLQDDRNWVNKKKLCLYLNILGESWPTQTQHLYYASRIAGCYSKWLSWWKIKSGASWERQGPFTRSEEIGWEMTDVSQPQKSLFIARKFRNLNKRRDLTNRRILTVRGSSCDIAIIHRQQLIFLLFAEEDVLSREF